MVRRLVLGCSQVGYSLIEGASDWSGDLYVITGDRGWVTTLRELNVAAAEGDPTNPRNYPHDVDVVIVAGSDPVRNREIAEAAARNLPNALLVSVIGNGADEETRAGIESVADRTIDPLTALTDRVLSTVSSGNGERMERLFSTLRSLTGPLAVVTHDNPDPDAIASGLALTTVAESVGVPAELCYYGEISHQENRALINLLDIPLRNLTGDDLSGYGGFALVDHSRPGVNDGLPKDTEVDIVVDHHPPRGPVEGRFVDLRSGVGATSTILTEYHRTLGIEPDRQTATALLYGIRIDTKDFVREVAEADFEAAAFLYPHVDVATLELVETPSMSGDVLRILALAIQNRELKGSALATCVGRIRNRDALAQAADRLLDMDGVTATLVYGYKDDVIYCSGRARGADIDLGETLRDAFGRIGSAGGHADMAGAQIPLGILADVEEESKESLTKIVQNIVSERFFETLDAAPAAPTHVDTLSFEFDGEYVPPGE